MSESVIKITICQNPETPSKEAFVIWTDTAAYGFVFGGKYHTMASKGQTAEAIQEFLEAVEDFVAYDDNESEICKNTERCVVYQKESH